MARWRVVEKTLIALLFLLGGAAARPAVVKECWHSSSTPFFRNTATNQVRRFHDARLTQDDHTEENIDGHGGFSVASSVGVAVSAAFTIAVIMSLSYSAYYRHAKLKLHRQLLERLVPSNSGALEQQSDVAPDVAIPDVPRRTRTAADTYGLAVLMSSSAQLSPAIYSALQEEDEPRSPVAPIEAKAKAVMEDKVLGRREDIIPLGRQFG